MYFHSTKCELIEAIFRYIQSILLIGSVAYIGQYLVMRAYNKENEAQIMLKVLEEHVDKGLIIFNQQEQLVFLND